jgi:hypothetical protein
LTGSIGESPVVPVGQIPTELVFAVICTSGSTGLDRWYRWMSGSTDRLFSHKISSRLTVMVGTLGIGSTGGYSPVVPVPLRR